MADSQYSEAGLALRISDRVAPFFGFRLIGKGAENMGFSSRMAALRPDSLTFNRAALMFPAPRPTGPLLSRQRAGRFGPTDRSLRPEILISNISLHQRACRV